MQQRIEVVTRRIRDAENRYGRTPHSVRLLAVSKTHPASTVAKARALGLASFGENKLQEAVAKIDALHDPSIDWHFIGPVQSNKTRAIALRFAWVHSVDRFKVARRLSQQRPAELPALNVLLEVNISGEASKSGVGPDATEELAMQVMQLPGLKLRGLMAIPAPQPDFAAQRLQFARLRELSESLNGRGLELDELSMGMSADLEAAIAEGSTWVRVGTALFGRRVT